MALSVVHKLRDRLLVQTEIDPDFSDMMFTYTEETDISVRREMLENYWKLKQGSRTMHT